jgi:hypothetical protein
MNLFCCNISTLQFQEEREDAFKKGLIPVEHYDDVLGKALPNREHPGRVRGVGSHVRMKIAYEGQPSKRRPRMAGSEAENEERIQREVDQRVAAQRKDFEDMATRLKAEMAEQTQQLVQQQLAQMMAQRTEPIAQDSPRAVQSSCQSVQPQPYFDPIQVIQRNTHCYILFN